MRCVSTSASHSGFVTNDGELWMCGLGSDSQLGEATKSNVRLPRRVEGISDIVQVACGSRHTLALRDDGVLFAFGRNDYGQLGVGERTVDGICVVETLDNVKSVGAGDDFSVAIDSNGRAYSWGLASLGRLGHGDERVAPSLTGWLLGGKVKCEKSPRLVKKMGSGRANDVACGKLHTVLVMESGSAFGFGSGRHYLLGTGTEDDVYEPITVNVVGGERIRKIVTGLAHTLVLSESGRVYAWGVNDHGALGVGSGGMMSTEMEAVRVMGISNVTDIAAGWHVSAAIVGPLDKYGKGDVYCWGSVQAGALGVHTKFDVWEPRSTGVRAGKVAIGAGGSHVFAY